MVPYCDLHTHSIYSDGSLPPEQLIHIARQTGLGAIALTDHNTVAGLADFVAAGHMSDVDAVPGIEISSEFMDNELHIVGLFVQPEHYAPIQALLDEMLHRKERSNRDLVQRLREAGFDLDYDVISAATPNGQINRAHVANAMVRAGYCTDTAQAFRAFLSPKCGYYVPPQRLFATDVIRFLRELGIVSILAHPFLSLKEDELNLFLPLAKEAGLVGMETLYARFTPEQTKLAQELANTWGLLPSGGSDFHGEAKPDISIGIGCGDLQVPMAYLWALRDHIR